MNSTSFVLGIIFIVGATAFLVEWSINANVASNSYFSSSYNGNKLYGGALEKAYSSPYTLGKAYSVALETNYAQQFVYNNKEEWDCSFGDEALSSPYPCVFDESLQKYCCVLSYWDER